jgi:hypothetical protein
MYNEVKAKNHIEGAHNEVARFTRLFMVGGWWGWWGGGVVVYISI